MSLFANAQKIENIFFLRFANGVEIYIYNFASQKKYILIFAVNRQNLFQIADLKQNKSIFSKNKPTCGKIKKAICGDAKLYRRFLYPPG